MQWSNVDLPEPDGPMIAVSFTVSNDTLIELRARTSASPLP